MLITCVHKLLGNFNHKKRNEQHLDAIPRNLDYITFLIEYPKAKMFSTV